MPSQFHRSPRHALWNQVAQALPFHWFHRANRIERGIHRHLAGASTLLDCGCGSMRVSRLIEDRSPIQAFGTDVMNLGADHPRFCVCAGEQLAFPDDTFDVVSLMFVLHHTDDPTVAIRECARVSRRHLLVLEDIYSHPLERQMLKALDVAGNYSISKDMAFPFNFKTVREWECLFSGLGLRLVCSEPIVPNRARPSRHRLFLLEK